MGGDKGELHGIYNSSWSRTGAFVLRVVGDAHEPKLFSTWGPKVIALIGALKDTTQDRSVVIPMRRRLKQEQIAKLRRPEGTRFESFNSTEKPFAGPSITSSSKEETRPCPSSSKT